MYQLSPRRLAHNFVLPASEPFFPQRSEKQIGSLHSIMSALLSQLSAVLSASPAAYRLTYDTTPSIEIGDLPPDLPHLDILLEEQGEEFISRMTELMSMATAPRKVAVYAERLSSIKGLNDLLNAAEEHSVDLKVKVVLELLHRIHLVQPLPSRYH
jgi:hypothetical protein